MLKDNHSRASKILFVPHICHFLIYFQNSNNAFDISKCDIRLHCVTLHLSCSRRTIVHCVRLDGLHASSSAMLSLLATDCWMTTAETTSPKTLLHASCSRSCNCVFALAMWRLAYIIVILWILNRLHLRIHPYNLHLSHLCCVVSCVYARFQSLRTGGSGYRTPVTAMWCAATTTATIYDLCWFSTA